MLTEQKPAPAFLPAPDAGRGPWARAWRQPAFRGQLRAAVALSAVLALALPRYFALLQTRPGYVLPDALLAHLPVHDVSRLTFTLLYLSVLLALDYLLRRPAAFLRVLWAYCFMHLLRAGTLALAPLNPPIGLLLLHDPLIDRLFYPAAVPITKDLFFSGHTATVALLALAVRRPWRRWALSLATGLIGALLLVQHAHYTYDVLAAPLFAGFSYWLAGAVTERLSN